MVERRTTNWYCVNQECSEVLGEVIGSELQVAKIITGDHVITRGPNLVLTCPNCGTPKTWYTSDQIVRAMYQLIDAIVGVAASRMVAAVSSKTLPKRE